MASSEPGAPPANDSSPTTTQKLGVVEKVGYGLGDTASNLFWKTFEFFLVYFYTDVFGLTAKSAGTLMLVTRIWDAINDPLVGYVADRTRTTWGRFRPYLIWMSIPFAITGMLTFYTPDLGPTGKLIYAYITYTLVMMAYTAINIPYGALMGVISSDSIERTSVSTYRFIAAFCGGIVVQYCTLDLVAFFGGTESRIVDGVAQDVVLNEQRGFFLTMVVFSIAAVVLFFITFATTKERVQPISEEGSTFRADLKFILTSLRLHQILLGGLALLACLATAFSVETLIPIVIGYVVLSIVSLIVRAVARRRFSQTTETSTFELDFNDLLSNRPWMVLFVFGLLQLSGLFIRGGAILYYFKYYCGDASIAPTFWVSGSFAAIAGMLLTKPLTRIFGKKVLMIGMNAGVALLTAAFVFLEPDQINMMIALQVAASFVGGPIPVLLWAMYADTADYSEWRSSRRATGLVFAAATFSQKMGCAVGAAMTGFALDFYQYAQPLDGVDQIQSDTTLQGLRMMMSLIPAAFLLLSAGCLFFYNIDKRLTEQIEFDLQARKSTDA
ncbi:MFS transporter [Rhodopirellula sp. SWK7]|uniref:MFS transporter n=1 Tax=Rhodopirellula sp. SWK7 TaxID=595460 RepID=UPI0002BD4AE6|nr:glycoside-pentoside-hexuronide (GPH):cation symporter [Rhodopirellula sp. SWK7]EMI42800.1 sugar (glycoside-Pentoside-hexuronide) transporter [Rhodopirellula sp. SWK7]